MSLEIQTEITKDDWLEFGLYHYADSAAVKRLRLILLLPGVLWSALWLGAAALSDTPAETAKALMPLILGGLIYVVLLLFRWRKASTRKTISRQLQSHLGQGENRAMFGQYRISLSEAGVAEVGEARQATTHWKAVEKVVVAGDWLYIYTSAFSAVIVPKRCFTDAARFEEFVAAARRYHALAAS